MRVLGLGGLLLVLVSPTALAFDPLPLIDFVSDPTDPEAQPQPHAPDARKAEVFATAAERAARYQMSSAELPSSIGREPKPSSEAEPAADLPTIERVESPSHASRRGPSAEDPAGRTRETPGSRPSVDPSVETRALRVLDGSEARSGTSTGSVSSPTSPAISVGIYAVVAVATLVLLVPFLTRLTPAEALRHPTRGRIYCVLVETDALTLGPLAEKVGVAPALVTYHVRVLVRSGALAASKVHGRVLYHVPGRQNVAPVASVRITPIAREIETQLRASSGMTLAELSAATGRSRQLVHYHVARLLGANLATSEGEGRGRVFRAPQS